MFQHARLVATFFVALLGGASGVLIGNGLEIHQATSDIILETTGTAKVNIGSQVDSFIMVNPQGLNQWHAHPNDLMLDTTGRASLGDGQGFANRTAIVIEGGRDAESIAINNHSGKIEIGDAIEEEGHRGNHTLLTVNDLDSTIELDGQKIRFKTMPNCAVLATDRRGVLRCARRGEVVVAVE